MTNSAPLASPDVQMRTNGNTGSDFNQYERPVESSKRSISHNYDILESNGKSAMILNHH